MVGDGVEKMGLTSWQVERKNRQACIRKTNHLEMCQMPPWLIVVIVMVLRQKIALAKKRRKKKKPSLNTDTPASTKIQQRQLAPRVCRPCQECEGKESSQSPRMIVAKLENGARCGFGESKTEWARI